MVRVVWAFVGLLMVPLLAGCIDGEPEGLRPVSATDVPVWKTGNTWTWATMMRGSSTYATESGTGSSSEADAGTVTHRVVNTAMPAFGRPAYWVLATGERSGALPFHSTIYDRSGLLAVAPDDLSLMGWTDPRILEPDSCEPRHLHGSQAEPLLHFPLTDGASWNADHPPIVITANVLGVERVTVPAGSFDAVLVRMTAETEWDDAPAKSPRQVTMEVQASHDVWYAPAVRNVVRIASELEVTYEDDDGGRSESRATSVYELTAYSLEEAADTPLHGLVPFHPASRGPAAMAVASDRAFPVNAADGPSEARFWLQDVRVRPDDASTERTPSPHTGWYDTGNQTLVWWVRAEDWAERYMGDVITVTLPPGGWFTVEAGLEEKDQDRACPPITPSMSGPGVRLTSRMSVAAASFQVDFVRMFEVSHQGPEPAAYELMTVPLAPGAVLTVEHEVTARGPFADDGGVVVRFADGRTVRLPEGAELQSSMSQNVTVEWAAEGRGVAGVLGVTFGHTAVGTLYVTYPSPSPRVVY